MKRFRIAKQNRKNESLHIPPGGGAEETPYPDFEITNSDKWKLDWDEKTRKLIIERIENVPTYRFFSRAEASLLEALCDCAIPQDDRQEVQRVPIAPWIDQRLYTGAGPGYRYENMPGDGQAYRLGLKGFDQTARHVFGADFIELNHANQHEIMRQVVDGSPPGETWQHLSATFFFQLFMNDVISNYYAHPSAWAEIGFSGPASPRGHIRLRLGRRDPWEAEERRPRSSVDIARRSHGKRKGPAKGGPTH